MRRYILSLAAVSLILGADEIQRIESIVKDITELRIQYEECQDKLDSGSSGTYSLEKKLKDEQQKNILLLSELETCTNSHQENEKLKFRILELEKSNIDTHSVLKAKYDKLLLERENRIKYLENQIKNQPKFKKSSFNQFPKLVMKEKVTQKTQEETQAQKSADKKKNTKEKIIKEEETAPSVYRLKSESDIYKSVDGDVVDRWEEERSFTSNRRYKNWIKITGYFVDQKWRKAEKELWILEKDVFKRD